MEFVVALLALIPLAVVAWRKPKLFGDRLFRPLYRAGLAVMLVVLVGVFVGPIAGSPALVRVLWALAVFGAGLVVLLPLSGKRQGLW